MHIGELYRVNPDVSVDLAQIDLRATSGIEGGKKEARELLKKQLQELAQLQQLLFAEKKHALLVVFQAMDAGGKDGTIRRVFSTMGPQGLRVAPFKKPSEQELAHDYLWRVHQQTPQKGEVVLFNRSHYEDVLVVRVHDLVPKQRWKKRYDHINHFEKMLADEGTTILKFYLHIDRVEQKKRFQARLDTPEKLYKFNPKDLDERKLWDVYMQAYTEMLTKTSTAHAPWYTIPANRKWYRNYVVASILMETLKGLHMQQPVPQFDPNTIVID